MSPEYLRKACEAAGLRYHSTPGPCFELSGWIPKYRPGDPALLPLVAERLTATNPGPVADVKAWLKYTEVAAHLRGKRHQVTAEQRILAALVALGHITIEEAREAMKDEH